MAQRQLSLRRTISRNWQLEALLLSLAGMEVCWFTPLFLAVTRSAWAYAPYAVALLLWLLVWGMMRVAFFLSERQINTPRYQLVVVGAVLFSALLVIRLYVYWSAPWSDLGWLLSTGRSLGGTVRAVPDELIVLATMLFLWWRAISLSQREHTFQTVGFEFRRNMLLLIISTLVLSFFVGKEVRSFIAPFFFFCLLAVALARVRDKSLVSGGIQRPFGPSWLLILSVASLFVLALAWALGSAYSVDGWRRLLHWLDPAFVWLGGVVGSMLVKLLRLVGPALEWLVGLIQRWVGSVSIGQSNESPLDEFLAQMQEGAGEYVGPPAWLTTIVRYLCPGLGIAVALLVIVLWLERRRRWNRQLLLDDSESTRRDGSTMTQDGGLLQQAWDRLRGLAAQVGHFGVGRRLYAAVSVRYVYANVVRLAERRGYPRAPAQTPLEFLPQLYAAFPGCDMELEGITEAYVRVHYGEVPATAQEMEALRSGWNRVRQAPAPGGSESQGIRGTQNGSGAT